MDALRRSTVPLVALCLTLAACGGSPDGTADDLSSDLHADELGDAPRVLALGDSMAFGWDPLREADPQKVDPAEYSGYAEILGKRYGLEVDNASCPGEASGSLVDVNARDNGCDQNRADYGLHVDWDAYAADGRAETQLEYIEGYLAQHVEAASPPAVITLDIGGNDLLLLQKECDLPLFLGSACMLARLPFYAHGYKESLHALFASIEASGYRGAVVVLTAYVPDYGDAVASFGMSQYNGALRDAAESARAELGLAVVVADGYGEFERRSADFGKKPCDAGLLIRMPDGSCDIHPSPAGHEALADAIQSALDGSAGGAF